MEKITAAQAFKKYVQQTEMILPPGKRWSKEGKKKYPFAKLKDMNIKNYTQLAREFKKIKERKSPLSASERDAVTHAMLLIKLQTSKIKIKK